ncbi:hypothetical protein LSUE1_G007193 [Lachnellula suecica]|uniref:Alkyl hydroperoxide reductase subunit C/ Thiol specific antioxidant domain-containing protein n=1 Tax=Lachnellula suecica TaxID=602035 RepID=A0A8T9C0Z3_9HELO|nr:hypothetical protein LSUE1_G007193 [Lachnellula suecica]
MDAQTPLDQFNALLSKSDFLFVVYFRGHWCPFCIAYLTQLSTLEKSITAAAGNTVIITAEPAIHLAETRSKTGYNGDAIVDETHVIRNHIKEKNWLDVAISDRKGYEHGLAQPAILVLRKDGTVLEKWAIVPSAMNLGGAKDRPDLVQVWENVQARLQGKQVVHASYKLQGFLGMVWGKIFG